MVTKTNKLGIARLRLRLQDIYSGACGRKFNDDDEWLTLEEASKVIPTLQEVFGEKHENWHVWGINSIGNFGDTGTAAEYLYSYGVRFNKFLEPK